MLLSEEPLATRDNPILGVVPAIQCCFCWRLLSFLNIENDNNNENAFILCLCVNMISSCFFVAATHRAYHLQRSFFIPRVWTFETCNLLM